MNAVVVPSEMPASSRGCRYPRQPREQQPGTVTLRNSLEILTNLYTHLDQQRGREGGGANCHTKARFVARKNCTTFESEHTSSEAWRNPYAK